MIKKTNWDKLGFWLTMAMLSVPFLYMILAYSFHVPLGNIHTAAGVPAAGLLALLLLRWKNLFRERKQIRWMAVSALLFFALTILGQLLGYQSILYYLSGLRNNGRYFVFFFACILFLKASQRELYRKLWDVLYFVNFAVTLYQFFVLGFKWDYLGGIFGVQAGCNAYTNVFLLITVTWSVLRYMNQEEKAWLCLAKCAVALVITALAELKIFVLEFAGIIVLAVLLTKFSRRKIFLIVGGLIGAVVCVQVMTLIFPRWSGWFSLEKIWKTAVSAKGYTGKGDMNRLTAVPIAWNQYLLTWPQKLFGLGLGNCDFAPFAAMTSPFYMENYDTNYYLFSSGFVMLETGLAGLVTYVGFFVVVFFSANSLQRSGKGDAVCCQMTQILSLMSLMLFIYNCTLRTEVGYMLYFAMALAFVREEA